MKKHHIEYDLFTYEFNELSEEAKQKVKEDYLNDEIRNIFFQEDAEEYIKELFPNSDLNIQYSLCYCQGDGFNIYGNIEIADILEHVKHDLTEKEVKFFEHYCKYFNASVKLPYNNRYCYCIVNRADFNYEISSDLEYAEYRNIPYKSIEKFDELAIEYLEELCNKFTTSGYNYLYDCDEEELEDWAKANGYEFLENGEIYI